MLTENLNALRLLNRSARTPTETYKSTTQHTTGSISHPWHCLFTRTTPRIWGSAHNGHRLFSLHSNPFLSTPRLWKFSLRLIFYTSSFLIWMWNPNPDTFSPTNFSAIVPMSSIIIFSLSLSSLMSPPLLLSFFAISHFSLQCYLSTLCT